MPPAAVRAMEASDWSIAAEIYAAGIAGGHATLETEVPTWAQWDGQHVAGHRLVAVVDGAVVGWVACTRVSDRCAQAGVLEVSVYVSPQARGRGVGSTLLRAVVDSTERAGVWTLQAGVLPENAGSLALLARHDFRVVGTRERFGRLGDTWRDVVLLERRSRVVGR